VGNPSAHHSSGALILTTVRALGSAPGRLSARKQGGPHAGGKTSYARCEEREERGRGEHDRAGTAKESKEAHLHRLIPAHYRLTPQLHWAAARLIVAYEGSYTGQPGPRHEEGLVDVGGERGPVYGGTGGGSGLGAPRATIATEGRQEKNKPQGTPNRPVGGHSW
jgi:hypothetical protein